MARRSNSTGSIAMAILVLPWLGLNWVHAQAGIPIGVLLGLAVGLTIALALIVTAAKRRRTRSLAIANIDGMTGTEFERYLKQLLSFRGYSVVLNGASGDLGVDLIARKAGEAIAVQAKRYKGTVSRRAVSDAVAGMRHYRCNRAMVITNSRFTPGARALAASNECMLVDRDMLASWIQSFQKGIAA